MSVAADRTIGIGREGPTTKVFSTPSSPDHTTALILFSPITTEPFKTDALVLFQNDLPATHACLPW